MIKGNSANDNGSWGIYAGVPSNGRTQRRRRRQPRPGQPRPAGPDHAACRSSATWSSCAGGPPICGDVVPPDTQIIERPPNPSTRRRRAVPLHRHRQRERRHVPVLAHRHGRAGGVRALQLAGGVRGPDASARTTSRCARSTPPATSTARPRATSGRSARSPPASRPRRRSSPGPTSRPSAPTPTFEFLASERNATFECRVDAAEFGPCAWTGVPGVLIGTRGTITYNGLSVGTHTFQVRAIDADGNVDATPAAWTWRVTEPPVPTPGVCGEFVTHEHQAHERPDRLPGPRPDRRRERHHDRPRRPRDRRHRARRRRAQQRLRLGDRHRRAHPRVRLRRAAQPRDVAERRHRAARREQPGGRHRPVRRRPERPRQHDPRQHDLRQQLRRRPLQRHAPHRRARQRVRRQLGRRRAPGAGEPDR